MRIYHLYILSVIFLLACKETSEHADQKNDLLQQGPLTIPLDLNKGYTLNKLTGDSITPRINPFGDTYKTGTPLPFIAKEIISERILKTKIIESVPQIKTIISDNVHPVPDKLQVTNVDTTRLKKVKLGEGDQSWVVRNTQGIVQTGVPIVITGKKMPFIEPHPVKASPMRFKDNATTNIQYLDVDQGLSYSYVEDICEDKKGNLWFCLDAAGVNKYDGINITNYTEKEGLSNNAVHCILEDKRGNIWLGTQHGVTCFDGNNFIQYTEKEGFPNNLVISISEDKKGNIWFCSLSGITKYNGKDFTNYTRKEGLPCDTVNKCIEDKYGNIWIATSHGAAKFDGNLFTYYTNRDGLSGEAAYNLVEGKDGSLWFGTVNGIDKFDGKSFTHFTKGEGLSNDHTLSMFSDRSGNIWIGTMGGGLNKFNGKYFTQYDLEQGLSSNKVRKITEDKSGNIWIGTDGGGVNRLNETSFDYKVPGEVLDNNRIRPILKDNEGNLWFGTDEGHVGKLATKPTGERLFTYYKAQDKLASKGQRSLLQDKSGNIWIGTTGSGIIKYDGKRFTNYFLGNTAESQSIFDILEDKKGNIWFGVRDGSIVMYDGKNFSSYTTKEGLPGTIIYSMLKDTEGNIWFCTQDAGIYKYDGTTLINYTEKEGLFCRNVTSIAEDGKGNLWFGSLGTGVCMFDGKNFTYYSKQQGLPDNNVWSAFCDSSEQLWFGTDKGLALFVPKSDSLKDRYTVYNFGAQDGLKAIDFNLHSVCVDNDNRIWWGTGKSVPSYNLNKKIYADSLRSLGISYVEINERFFDFRNLSDSSKSKINFSSVVSFYNYPNDLTLTYDQNHLIFHFAAIDWSAPHKIKYSYRLIGSGEEWSTPSTETTADYRNLNYGNYEFQVKAIGQSQVWTQLFIYKFSIRPAWWQTWWFKTSAAIVSVFVIIYFMWLIYLYRLRKQKSLLEKKLAVQYERQRISADLHDDIGSTLSSINIYAGLAKKQGDNQLYLDSISQNINDVVGKLDDLVWSIKAGHDTFGNIIERLKIYAEPITRSKQIAFSISMNDDLKEVKPPDGIKHHLFMTAKELINNAIKHADCKNIDIEFKKAGNTLYVIVKDDGKGFNENTISKDRNGLKNITQRVNEMEGRIDIRSSVDDGTTVSIQIPV